MIHIAIKPLSVNGSYRGRHFPTPELESYKQSLAYLLPRGVEVPKGKLAVRYVFGLSSKSADLDNVVKAFQDSLCRKYDFDDRDIWRIEAAKVIVKRGNEYVEFEINQYQ